MQDSVVVVLMDDIPRGAPIQYSRVVKGGGGSGGDIHGSVCGDGGGRGEGGVEGQGGVK